MPLCVSTKISLPLHLPNPSRNTAHIRALTFDCFHSVPSVTRLIFVPIVTLVSKSVVKEPWAKYKGDDLCRSWMLKTPARQALSASVGINTWSPKIALPSLHHCKVIKVVASSCVVCHLNIDLAAIGGPNRSLRQDCIALSLVEAHTLFPHRKERLSLISA